MRSFKFLIFLLILFAVAGMNWYCGSVEKTSVARTTYAGLTDSAKYVGIETCKGCHANVHSTFIHTGMGQSFDHASKIKSSANFENHPVVYDKYKDFYYTPLWDGDSLKFKEFRLEGKDTIYQRIQTIKYIVGSGQHTNSHLWESNGYVYQAPMTFYTQKQKWDLPPGFENGNNSRFNRLIGLECMTCHNGYPEFELGSENKYNLVKQGIDCERCHGPGSIHVKEKSSGQLVDTSKYVDYSIVNPSKLPIALQLDVCQRCHVQGNAVLNEGKSFFDFRPGMKLSDVMNVFMPVYAGREQEHIMASHAERLKESKCYLVTLDRLNKNPQTKNLGLKPYKNALTCITCHNPHLSVKYTNDDVFNAACKNCHQENKDNLCTDDKSLLAKAKNNCVSCHMSFSGATDIPHVSVHDHKIAIPSKKINIDAIKKFIGINCINNPNPPNAAIAQAYINYYEKFALGVVMLDSALNYLPRNSQMDIENNIIKLVQVYFLKHDYATVINYAQKVKDLNSRLQKVEYDNANAWTSYRIAESFYQLGNQKEAFSWFKLAYSLAPKSAEFTNKYGTALVNSGQQLEAKKIFSSLVKEHPEYAPGFSNLGYLALSIDGNQNEAERLYNLALALDPDYESALLNKAGLLIIQHNNDGAIKLIKRILKINPTNQQAKIALMRLSLRS